MRVEYSDKIFQTYNKSVNSIIEELSPLGDEKDMDSLRKLLDRFKTKTEDFFRDERKLNIGVVGQVKAGKSSFLNTLLFNGEEILPKASTPKTATLTKMEYAEENIIHIEYYTEEEWGVLEENEKIDIDDEIYTSAKEIVSLVRKNGIDPHDYLPRKYEDIRFDTYDDLISNLNNYVGEDVKFTPIVKAVTLYLHKKEFEGLSIVDTPGLNDPIASRTIRTKEFMEVCDVVFFLSQSGSFLDKSDWILLSSQLPQKGVKKLVLIASKYDSGVRDVLREKTEDDDIFGEDENTADNIPKARKIIQKKLRKRAKSKVDEFVKDLEQRGASNELIEVMKGCSEPVLVSSMTYNMSNKKPEEFSKEEQNVYYALKKFSSDIDEDLKLLGNFDEVREIFESVVNEKNKILEMKARTFVPDATEELRGLLISFKEKAEKRKAVLSGSDRDKLNEQKRMVESQIGNIKSDIAGVFGDLATKLEAEKAEGIRELREASKDHLDIRERTGTVTREGSYTTGWWIFKKTHYYTYEDHYSYFIASDAIDNLRQFSIEASNKVEEVFIDAIQHKEIKRKLLNVVVNNFDMGSEKFDSSLFKIMVEEVVSSIEFPVFKLDISDALNGIAGKFTGELTSAGDKAKLTTALSKAMSDIYNELCEQLTTKVKDFKQDMSEVGKKIQVSLLEGINQEFEKLLKECENRDEEIASYDKYITALEAEVSKL